MDNNYKKLYELARQISPEDAFRLVLLADSEEECRFWSFVLYMNMGGLRKEQ